MVKTTEAVTAWAHLPNAKHIDRILAHLKANPDKWGAVRDDVRDAARGAAWDDVRYVAWGDARDAAWDAAWVAAWDAAWDAAWGTARGAAWDAARGAVAALIVWDDVAPILNMSEDEVRALAMMGMPAPILLLPAVIALNN